MATAEQKLKTITKSTQAILANQSFEEAARAIFDYCCEITGAISGYVALLNPSGEENEVLFLESGGLPCFVDPKLPMPIRGLRETAYRTHKPAYDNDFMNSEWVKFMPAGHVKLRNVMFSPLNIEGKTVGIMGLANKPSDFTEEDAEIAGLLGEIAAIGLQNSRYIEQLNDKNQELEKALAEVKALKEFIPLCAWCKKVRDDQGYWDKLDFYLSEHFDASFSHSMCPDCQQKELQKIGDE